MSEFKLSNNLNVISTLHIIKGILSLVGAAVLIIYFLAIGFFIDYAGSLSEQDIPTNLGMGIAAIGIFFAVFGIIIGVLNLIARSKIEQRKSRTFIQIVSYINIFSGVLGLALGIFTLIELNREHVRALFEPK